MYMSYCRFEGTRSELFACLEVVEEHLMEEAEYSVSDREIDCFQSMVETFFDFMKDNCLIDDDVELNRDELMAMCEAMSNGEKAM